MPAGAKTWILTGSPETVAAMQERSRAPAGARA
jgi:hypothetical protein